MRPAANNQNVVFPYPVSAQSDDPFLDPPDNGSTGPGNKTSIRSSASTSSLLSASESMASESPAPSVRLRPAMEQNMASWVRRSLSSGLERPALPEAKGAAQDEQVHQESQAGFRLALKAGVQPAPPVPAELDGDRAEALGQLAKCSPEARKDKRPDYQTRSPLERKWHVFNRPGNYSEQYRFGAKMQPHARLALTAYLEAALGGLRPLPPDLSSNAAHDICLSLLHVSLEVHPEHDAKAYYGDQMDWRLKQFKNLIPFSGRAKKGARHSYKDYHRYGERPEYLQAVNGFMRLMRLNGDSIAPGLPLKTAGALIEHGRAHLLRPDEHNALFSWMSNFAESYDGSCGHLYKTGETSNRELVEIARQGWSLYSKEDLVMPERSSQRRGLRDFDSHNEKYANLWMNPQGGWLYAVDSHTRHRIRQADAGKRAEVSGSKGAGQAGNATVPLAAPDHGDQDLTAGDAQSLSSMQSDENPFLSKEYELADQEA